MLYHVSYLSLALILSWYSYATKESDSVLQFYWRDLKLTWRYQIVITDISLSEMLRCCFSRYHSQMLNNKQMFVSVISQNNCLDQIRCKKCV